MDSIEKERVVKDLVNYYTHKGTSVVEEDLEELSDDELKSKWFENVGRYIHFMQDWDRVKFENNLGEKKWIDEGFETVEEWQFDKLTSVGIVDYRFDSVEYTQPY